jgi:hypothetical protein
LVKAREFDELIPSAGQQMIELAVSVIARDDVVADDVNWSLRWISHVLIAFAGCEDLEDGLTGIAVSLQRAIESNASESCLLIAALMVHNPGLFMANWTSFLPFYLDNADVSVLGIVFLIWEAIPVDVRFNVLVQFVGLCRKFVQDETEDESELLAELRVDKQIADFLTILNEIEEGDEEFYARFASETFPFIQEILPRVGDKIR